MLDNDWISIETVGFGKSVINYVKSRSPWGQTAGNALTVTLLHAHQHVASRKA